MLRSDSLAIAMLRWLVLFVVWFDLVGSPLHAHHHDIGVDLLQLNAAAATDGADPVADTAPALAPGHSQAALRGSKPGEPEPSLDFALLVARWLLPQTAETSGSFRTADAVAGAPTAPPHERPASRAPPLLA